MTATQDAGSSRGAQPAEVPAHEGLREVNVVNQLRDRGRPLRQALKKPQTRGIRQGLVIGGHSAQLVRRSGNRGESGAYVGGRGHASP